LKTYRWGTNKTSKRAPLKDAILLQILQEILCHQQDDTGTGQTRTSRGKLQTTKSTHNTGMIFLIFFARSGLSRLSHVVAGGFVITYCSQYHVTPSAVVVDPSALDYGSNFPEFFMSAYGVERQLLLCLDLAALRNRMQHVSSTVFPQQ
jgi:hypothetical protein